MDLLLIIKKKKSSIHFLAPNRNRPAKWISERKQFQKVQIDFDFAWATSIVGDNTFTGNVPTQKTVIIKRPKPGKMLSGWKAGSPKKIEKRVAIIELFR